MRRIQQKRSRKSTEASLSITRHYAPDLARQVKALLRLLESCHEESVRVPSGEDISQQDMSTLQRGGNQDEKR